MGFFDRVKEKMASENSPWTPSHTDNYQDFTQMPEPQVPEKDVTSE